MHHSGLVPVWGHVFRESGVGVTMEVPLYRLGVTEVMDSQRRMDLVTQAPPRWWDTTIVHPGGHLLLKASQQAGAAIERAEKVKSHKYDRPAAEAGAQFTPLAGETFGRWSAAAVAAVRDAATAAMEKSTSRGGHPVSTGIFVARFCADLSVALQRGNAAYLRERALTAADSREGGHMRLRGPTADEALLALGL